MPGENLPGERIESLVDELEGIIQESKAPFGKAQQKIIETEVFFNILDEIRMSYPEEWQKSRRILRERDELLASATAQADSIIADAQQQALTIAGEQPAATIRNKRITSKTVRIILCFFDCVLICIPPSCNIFDIIIILD